jgi:two-component sensor histidine kinase
LVGFIGSAVDITETKRAHGHLASALIIAEQQRQRESLLRRELDHRVRNNLAALRGLLTLYERTGRPGREVAEAMRGKFLALTEVHELIARSSRRGVRVDDIVARLVRALVPASRLADFRTQGDHTELPASQVGALAMILHELLANSLKHGGLADPAGRVSVEWSADPNGQGLSLVWRESGTAPQAVAGTGVGLGLIRGLARSELRGEAAIDFETAGLVCTLHASFDHVDRDTPSLASPAAPAEHPHPAELIMTAGRSEDPESQP